MTAPRGGNPARSPGPSSGARGAIVIGLAVILGIIGLQILDDSGDGSSSATASSTPGATTPDGAVTTTRPLRAPSEVRVKVYNASGVGGRAQTLTDILMGKGYNMQKATTLDKERQGTVIECTSDFMADGNLLSYLHVPGSTVQPLPSDPPAGAGEADCLVIIGT